MTKLEFDVCLNVIKQFYIMDELGSIIDPIYDESKKCVFLDWILPITLDKNILNKLNIENDYSTELVRYVINDFKSFLYFIHYIRNEVSNILSLNTIDAQEYMIESANQHILKKEYFNISNESWITTINRNDLYMHDIEIREVLDNFDRCVNTFLQDDEVNIETISDVELYSENGIDNCLHFTIKEDNYIKQYNRHSNGFLYSKKIINDDHILYVGHYFNAAKNGEVVSIIYKSLNKNYNIKYNINTKEILINDNIQNIDTDKINHILEHIKNIIEENKYEKKH